MLMYSTCIFCNQTLGTNEAIEIFPVGRRISFDAAQTKSRSPGLKRDM